MITSATLTTLIADLGDHDFIEVTKNGHHGDIGDRVSVLPGVAGPVVRHDKDGDTVVQVKVHAVRRVLKFLVS